MRDTPESDQAMRFCFGTDEEYILPKVAERLERQRDEARCVLSAVMRWKEMTNADMRLHAGEMTSQEIRTVRAVLNQILPEPPAEPMDGGGDATHWTETHGTPDGGGA